MEVFVIRHTPVAVGKDTCYGQTDVPLAHTFLQDILHYKTQLPIGFDAVFCSPLQRCKDLAMALNCQNIVYEPALMEMNFGDWELKKWNNINPNDLDIWMQDFVNTKTPNGENLQDLFSRMQFFLDNLRLQPYKKVLIITHAGTIRCMWAYLLAIPLHNIFKIPVGFNEIFAFTITQNPNFDGIRQMK